LDVLGQNPALGDFSSSLSDIMKPMLENTHFGPNVERFIDQLSLKFQNLEKALGKPLAKVDSIDLTIRPSSSSEDMKMSDIDTSSKEDTMDSENQMIALLHTVLVHIRTY
jgi:hypothetical protein